MKRKRGLVGSGERKLEFIGAGVWGRNAVQQAPRLFERKGVETVEREPVKLLPLFYAHTHRVI
jgi:hypothetical protein